MRKIRVSATQISSFLSCQRGWAAGYVLGIRQPQTEAMAFGEVGHRVLQLYHDLAKPIDEDRPWQWPDKDVRFPGRSAKKALKHIPAPKTGKAEQGFSYTIKSKAIDIEVEFIGYIDLEWRDDKGLWLLDYKFTSSFSNALDQESLVENVQSTIYATKAFLQDPALEEVNLRWLYLLSSKTPRARPVEAKVTKEENRERLRGLVAVAAEMVEAREKVLEAKAQYQDPLGVEEVKKVLGVLPPTVESCGKYNGCYYTDRCELTEEQMIEGDMNMSMTPDLREKLEKAGVGKYLKNNAPEEKIEAKKAEAPPKEKETTIAPTEKKKTDANPYAKYMKKPSTPKESGKPAEPKVRLNAPENYVDAPAEQQEEQRPQKQCFCKPELSEAEKDQLIDLFTKLVKAA